MSDNTGIEWCDATWNPVTGCAKVSEGCRSCYAKTFTERFKGAEGHYFSTGFDVTLRPEKLEQPLRWTRPRRIFVNSMSDLFHPDVPDAFIEEVFAIMAIAKQHTFMVLTKRPDRMLKWFSDIRPGMVAGAAQQMGYRHLLPDIPISQCWPLANVWIGVSVENQQAADERIPLLLQTPAAVRFLSCEPLLGPVNIRGYLMQGKSPGKCGNCGRGHGFNRCPNYGGIARVAENHGCSNFKRVDFAIDWVIVGGESGSKARPMHPWWAQELRDQCQAAAVPFFFKQWGEWRETHALRCNEPGIKGKPWYTFDPDTSVCRIGKQAAGRDLNGRTWDEFPEGVQL